VAELIKELTDKTSFRDLINVQQELILGIESDKVLPQIEDLISNKCDLITVIIRFFNVLGQMFYQTFHTCCRYCD